MVVLLVLIEMALANQSLDFLGDASFAWRWGAKAARIDAPKSEILSFGDSLVKFGVAPRVVESRSGRTMWNLAVTGGRSASSYFLLRRALDAGARPSALVLDADLLYTDPYEVPFLWTELASPGEIAEMAWMGRNARFFAHYGLAWALPSVRSRFEIRSVIQASLRGESTTFRAASKLSDRNWKINRGASILPATHQLSAQSVVAIDSTPPDAEIPGQWKCNRINAVYLDRFLDLALEREIPVFWVFPPHYRMLERYFERPNWSGLQRQFARDRLNRYPNLVVIDGLHANYDRSVVMDVSHLNRSGAVAFSLALGDLIRDRLSTCWASTPRWVELPAFREPPTDVPVEDLAQSVLAVSRRR